MKNRKGVATMFTDIIWDFDGTLFDTYPPMTEAFKRALNDLGYDDDEKHILGHLKLSVSQAVEYYQEKFGLGEELREIFWKYENNMDKHEIKPFQYAKEVCQRVKESGRRNYVYTHRGDSTYEYLSMRNMDGLFTDIVTKTHGLKGKPSGDGFVYIMDKHGLDRKNVLAVGDRDLDILAAKDAGIASCFFVSNGVEGSVKADYTVYSFKDMLPILDI